MADPQTNITEEGMPGDLSAAAADEFGGASDEGGALDVAADDAGTGALAGNTGKTAGGLAELGVGGQSGPSAAGQESGAAEIAADDAGAGRRADQANGSGAD
jgi:hypothetical protein